MFYQAKDVLQSNQYDFNRSAVPEDDDLEVLEVIPARDTSERKCVPFIYVIHDDNDNSLKVEPKEEPQASDTLLVTPKPEPQPDTRDDRESPTSNPPTKTVGNDNDDDDPNSEAISLEVESAREDNLEDVDKMSDKEQMLLKQVELLTKGLEEMRHQIRRQKMSSAKHSLATKLRHKMLRTKIGSRKQKKPSFDGVKRKSEPESSVNSPVEVHHTDVQWEEVKDSKLEQCPDDNIQPEENTLEAKPVEETNVTKTFPESMEKQQVKSHFEDEQPNYGGQPSDDEQETDEFDEPIIGSQLVANEMILGAEEVAGTQVTASEVLALLCDSEANTEKTDEMVVSAKSDLQHDDDQSAGHDGVMANELHNDGEPTGSPDETTDHSYAVQGKGTEVSADELKCDEMELSSKATDMKSLQEGVKNIAMGDNYGRSNSEEFSENDGELDDEQPSDDEQPTDDELLNPDDDVPTNNEFLGDAGNLSEVDEEEEKLLAGGGKQLDLDDNSSSGASRGSSAAGDSVQPVDEHGGGNEYLGKPTSEESEQQEPVENVNQPQSSVGNVESSERVSTQKLPSFLSVFSWPQFQEQSVVMMNTGIHPPGINEQIQQLMKSRLPSTSSVLDAELSPAVEKMMDARMGIPQALSQCKVAVTAIPMKSLQTVLKAKDTNVMGKKNYDPAKGKPEGNIPLQSTAPTQMSLGAPTNTEEEDDE